MGQVVSQSETERPKAGKSSRKQRQKESVMSRRKKTDDE